jgi:ABC-type polysaccharide/polyol phosphate transport system ATPase subunit
MAKINASQDLSRQLKPRGFVDSEVQAETDRVDQIFEGKQADEALSVLDLKKYFIRAKGAKSKKKATDEPNEDSDDDNSKDKVIQAVNGTSFSLKKQESFALLGVNGAGKSTTFKCMSIEEIISDGQIRVGGHSVSKLYNEPALLRNLIGYCP